MAQVKFLGATVISASFSGGWNEQATSATVRLVEDKLSGDRFRPPAVGSPVVLDMGTQVFQGILQKPETVEGFDGDPTFNVVLNGPDEILDSAKVLLNTYAGATNGVPNLLNAFGYWEHALGFGGSLVNEAGMLWSAPFEVIKVDPSVAKGITITPTGVVGVRPALDAMFRSGGAYGGLIQYHGHSYAVDFSALPAAPAFYRVGGVAESVLAIVSQLCQDAACDYMAYLDGATVRFKVASRASQPALGAVANFVKGHPQVTSRSYGVELRSDVTNAVLFGGDVHELIMVSYDGTGQAVWPYWGEKFDGSVVLGDGDPAVFHTAEVDSSEIADVYGSTAYTLSLAELRCAAVDFESWAAYVLRWDADKAKAIGLVNSIDSTSDLQELFPTVIFQRDLIMQEDEHLQRFGAMNQSDYWTNRATNVYNFVRRFADEYYGRKFLVRVPFFIYWHPEPESTRVVSSYEVADGGYLPEGATPFGLDYFLEDRFLTEDGRWGCLVTFPFDDRMDLGRLNPDNYAVSNGKLFMRATVERNIVYPSGSVYPHVIVTLADPVFQRAPDPLGGIKDVAAVLDVTPESLAYAAALRYGSFPVRVSPAPYMPGQAAVPLRNSRQSYGPFGSFAPWGTPGVPGKVHVERDESLVPWNYGGYDVMNQAAVAKFAGIASNQQSIETAQFEEVGTPTRALGDVVVAGGPNVTGITCSFSDQGVKTSYTLQTYTPHFGGFQRQNADRLRRLGLAALQTRKTIRALFLRNQAGQAIVSSARRAFMENTARAVRQMTPHDAVYATMFKADDHGYRTQVAFSTLPEMAANIRADHPPHYLATGGATLESLYRPYSTATASGDMPHYETPSSGVPSGVVTTVGVDPLRDSDVDILVTGPTYPGVLHRLKKRVINGVEVGLDYDNARGVGNAVPMTLVGYGRDLTGKPVPNSGDMSQPVHLWSDQPLPDYKTHPEKFRVGIHDVKWDNWRKVWTSPGTILTGTAVSDFAGSGNLTVTVRGVPLPDQLTVHNDLGGVINSGAVCHAAYNALEDWWKVIAAQCPASGG